MEHIQEAERYKWTAHSNHSIKCFTKGGVERMTNNYRNCIGRGAFGEVYEGVLEDESMVAVKRFISNVKENFAKELIVHREINHKNVVRLIGYCEEDDALMLVMEYIANGNLSDALHNHNHDCPISLDIRLRIAIECAEALVYMHSHMYTQVIHGDLKPGNILLDSNFHAKLSDFGISRLANTDKTLKTENVIGSIGYMDPLFSQDGCVTVKYDVYSFGVVLFELITRKKATTVVDNINIVYAFTNALGRGIRGVREMFDADIASKNNMKLLEGVAKLAGECLRMDRNKRPSMIEVAERLRMLQKSSHQDQGRQQLELLSWGRKSNPASMKISANIANILVSDVYRRFSLAEIKGATNNFDESLLVGDGLSKVYCGHINNGRKTNVAIKHYYQQWNHQIDEFYAEILMMSKHRHRHLVPLIGYCFEKKEMILVYDYMVRGSLGDHLHGTQKLPLTWKRRIEICIGAARGLGYLHEQQMIHRDVTLDKILLDGEWVAKIISGLSLCRTGTTYMVETMAYLDPEYYETGEVTEKSDVYSFGVVLLGTLSARPAADKHEGLVSWALRCKEERNLDQIVDQYLMGRVNPWSLNKFAGTAFKCIAPKRIDRPSMGEVISDLEHALQLHESGDTSSGAKILLSCLRRQFSLAEMEVATNNFDESLLLTDSGFPGRVYLGEIDRAAITVVDVTLVYSACAFHSLIETMSKLGHVHLVPLTGYCHEKEMTLLVYECVGVGNLREHLDGTRKPPLGWIQRMETCIAVARGLHYLHGSKLTHGAVRTSNILLDDECVAKITNLAPLPNALDTHATTGVCETERSDVYCFGLVLLEVLFARPVVGSLQGLEEQVARLVRCGSRCQELGYLDPYLDPFLMGNVNPRCLNKFFQTAVKCLADGGVDRPSMRDVISDLEHVLQMQKSGEDGGSMSDKEMDEGR